VTQRAALLAAVLFFALPAAAQKPRAADRITIGATAGKSITTWHGQVDMQTLDVELAHNVNARWEIAGVAAAHSLWQPRSWFGNLFHDGSESVYGASVSLLARRRLRPVGRFEPHAEGAIGPMWATRQIPDSTSRFNFITQVGAGVSVGRIVIGYRFQHVSNGGYSPRNPGVNVSSLVLGVRLGR
jgi:lipid A 3-O-deacylase